MKTSELLLSILDITEDDYSYKGQFTLSAPGKSKIIDITDIEKESAVRELIKFFSLEEQPSEIRNILMGKVMEMADISSMVVEGEQRA